MTTTLPSVIRQEIAKLPDTVRDVVAQRLRDGPSPPIIYEDAVRQLAAVRDIDTTKRAYIAADGLALWGKLHEDNRAILEAQKLKAHALRQMFICAKMLGEPYQVLQEKKIWHNKAKRAEELASFEDKNEIDSVADEIGIQGRPEFLVGRIADESPLGQEAQREAQRRRDENERRYRDQQRQAAEDAADPKQQFKDKVLHQLAEVLGSLQQVEKFSLAACTKANKKQVRDMIAEIMEALDRIDAACSPRTTGSDKPRGASPSRATESQQALSKNEPFLTRKAAAEYINSTGVPMTECGLANHASRGTGPKYSMVNGRAIYRRSDLAPWLTPSEAES